MLHCLMKISFETLPQARTRATVEIPEERVLKAEEEALRALGSKITVQGFRPGNAPLHAIRERVPERELQEEMVQRLLPELLQSVITQAKVTPIIPPRVELRSRTPFLLFITLIAKPTVMISTKKLQKDLADRRATQIGKPLEEEALLEAVASHIQVELAPELIEDAVRDLLEQQVRHLAEHGATFQEWLTQSKKTLEQFIAELRPHAEKRLRIRFGVGALMTEWKFEVRESEMQEAVTALLAPLSEEERTKLQPHYIPGARAYEQFRSQKIVEKVIERLQKGT